MTVSESILFKYETSVLSANCNFIAAFNGLRAEDVKKLVFEDQLIEGKIRRPQLVLIKADQRPVFNSMVLQSKGKAADISATINDDIIQDFPYKGPFRIENSKITNIEP